MAYSTIDLFATKHELITFAREFADGNGLWVTALKFTEYVVTSPSWIGIDSKVQDELRPDEQMELILTTDEPCLDGVTQMHNLLQINSFEQWVCFAISCANESYVLESSIITYASNDCWQRKCSGLMRKIRTATKSGFWGFAADMSCREYHSKLKRYTDGAKALQDSGAKVSSSSNDPPYILGETCPYPLSEIPICSRNAR